MNLDNITSTLQIDIDSDVDVDVDVDIDVDIDHIDIKFEAILKIQVKVEVEVETNAFIPGYFSSQSSLPKFEMGACKRCIPVRSVCLICFITLTLLKFAKTLFRLGDLNSCSMHEW